MTEQEYINSVIGKPWVNRAEGPDSFDCWGLVLDSFRVLDGVELPQIAGYCDHKCKTSLAANEAIGTGLYVRCEPEDGAIMVSKFNNKIVHVGRCLMGGVLHTAEGIGARFDKYRAIKATQQQVEYYRYANNPSS